jgi:hypothetical protein
MINTIKLNVLKKRRLATSKLPVGAILLYIFWPFASFIYALRNYRSHWSSKIYILFAVFFGFTFVQYGDALRVAAQLEAMQSMSISEVFGNYFSSGSTQLDIVYPILIFLVSKITLDYRFLFAILTLIYSVIITKSITFLLSNVKTKVGWIDGLILVSFAITVQLWYIGGRWNLAALVFAYNLLKYFYSKQNKYLFLSFFSVFIHWSFVIVIPIVVLYLIAKNRTWIFYVLFVISFFISFASFQELKGSIENYAPSIILESRSGYLNEEYREILSENMEKTNWYVSGHQQVINWFVLFAVSFIVIAKQNVIKKSKRLFNVFNFSLLFMAITNTLSLVPSMGRFYTVGNWLLLAVFFLYFHQAKGTFIKPLKYFSIVALSLFIVVRIRMSLDAVSIWTLFGNPFYVYFVENDKAIIEFVKELIL